MRWRPIIAERDGISHSIARNRTNDYWNLKRIPRETKNYVPCYLAALTIAKNPKCFGVVMPPHDTLPLDTVRVKDCISLGDIAGGLNIPCDSLKKINPHMLRWCTPAESLGKRVLFAQRPQKALDFLCRFASPEEKVQWYRYKSSAATTWKAWPRNTTWPPMRSHPSTALQRRGWFPAIICLFRFRRLRCRPRWRIHRLRSPKSEPSIFPDYEFSGIALRHRVRSGDCLGKIARHYHVSVTQLCRWNRLTGRTLLKPGRILIVSRPQPPMEPALPPASAVAAAAPAPPRVQPDTVGKQVPQEKAAPAQPAPAVAMPPKAVETHVVEIGETPFSISRKTNVPIKDLAALNGLDMAHPIVKIGQVLVLGAASVPVKVSSTRAGTPLQKPSASPQVVRNGQNRFHVIAPGEDVFRISLRYSVSVDSLLALNRKSDALQVRIGDTLLIPPGKDTLLKPPASASRPDVIYYKVKDGDTLPRIAAELGVPVDSLYKENQLRPNTVFTPGKVIRIVKVSGM